MSARKRLETETFEEYRENLKREHSTLKNYLLGRVVFQGKTYRKKK